MLTYISKLAYVFAMMNACPVCHVNEAYALTPYRLWITGLLVPWPAVAKLVATSRDNLFNNAFESFPFFFFHCVSVNVEGNYHKTTVP